MKYENMQSFFRYVDMSIVCKFDSVSSWSLCSTFAIYNIYDKGIIKFYIFLKLHSTCWYMTLYYWNFQLMLFKATPCSTFGYLCLISMNNLKNLRNFPVQHLDNNMTCLLSWYYFLTPTFAWIKLLMELSFKHHTCNNHILLINNCMWR